VKEWTFKKKKKRGKSELPSISGESEDDGKREGKRFMSFPPDGEDKRGTQKPRECEGKENVFFLVLKDGAAEKEKGATKYKKSLLYRGKPILGRSTPTWTSCKKVRYCH